jgi:hypothetical protein
MIIKTLITGFNKEKEKEKESLILSRAGADNLNEIFTYRNALTQSINKLRNVSEESIKNLNEFF